MRLLIALTLLLLCSPLAVAESVCKVTSGDSFKFCGGPEAKLQCVKAPTTGSHGKQAGQASQTYLKKLILAHRVNKICFRTGTKKQECVIQKDRKDTDIGYRMVAAGWAYPQTDLKNCQNPFGDMLKQGMEEARAKKLGVWKRASI